MAAIMKEIQYPPFGKPEMYLFEKKIIFLIHESKFGFMPYLVNRTKPSFQIQNCSAKSFGIQFVSFGFDSISAETKIVVSLNKRKATLFFIW